MSICQRLIPALIVLLVFSPLISARTHHFRSGSKKKALPVGMEDLFKEMWAISGASYCMRNDIIAWDVGSTTTNYIPITRLVNVQGHQGVSVYDGDGFTRAVIGYDTQTHIAFLVFRGTIPSSPQNLYQDLTAIVSSNYVHAGCDGCKVGSGLKSAYDSIAAQNIIRDFQMIYNAHSTDTNPPPRIVVSGHSLGGAMANFGFIDVCDTLGSVDIFVTFGAPRVGNSYFADWLTASNCAANQKYRVTYNRDLIPHVPFGYFGIFKHAGAEIFYRDNNQAPADNCGQDTNTCSGSLWLTASLIDHGAYMGMSGSNMKCVFSLALFHNFKAKYNRMKNEQYNLKRKSFET